MLNYKHYEGDKVRLLVKRNEDEFLFSKLRDEEDLERLLLILLNNEKFRCIVEDELDIDVDNELSLRTAVLEFELSRENQDISIIIKDENGDVEIPIFQNGKPFVCRFLQTDEVVTEYDVKANHFEKELEDIINDLKKEYLDWNDIQFKEKALSMLNVILITN